MLTFTTPLWSADGNQAITADGYPGWSADGYEPTTLGAAIGWLGMRGYFVGQVSTQYSTLVPAGLVITGYPGKAALAGLGGYVNLIISAGPAPVSPVTPSPGVGVTIVPNVVGLYYYDAQLAILNAKLLIQAPTWVLNAAVKPGYVISQTLTAGSTVNQQTGMAVVVSGHPNINTQGIPIGTP